MCADSSLNVSCFEIGLSVTVYFLWQCLVSYSHLKKKLSKLCKNMHLTILPVLVTTNDSEIKARSSTVQFEHLILILRESVI